MLISEIKILGKYWVANTILKRKNSSDFFIEKSFFHKIHSEYGASLAPLRSSPPFHQPKAYHSFVLSLGKRNLNKEN